MTVTRQYTHPTIDFISYKDFKIYKTFSPTESTELQSYNYKRAINSIEGSFTLTIKSTSVNSESSIFINSINPLDIIAIYEDSKTSLDFLGVVSDIGFASTATQGGGIIQISGKSIDSLFNRYKISNDKMAMASFNAKSSDIDNSNELLKINNKKKKLEPLKLNDIVATSWKNFNKAVEKNSLISNFQIGKIIKHFYGEDFWDKDAADIEFQYPIQNHLFKDGESKFIDYLKELLPEKVYECFGTIIDNVPKLRIRQVPFTSKRWRELLPAKEIPLHLLTDYSFTRSDNEVYTSFFTYLQGSIESADFYRAITATSNGYNDYRSSDVAVEKASLYGYEPLFINFTGFPSGFKTKDMQKNTNDSVIAKFKAFNEECVEMFSRLDEMYSGNISCVRISDYKYPQVGERIKICGLEFYINEEKHVWQYGKPITVSYSISRGGVYNNGVFSKGEITSILKKIKHE